MTVEQTPDNLTPATGAGEAAQNADLAASQQAKEALIKEMLEIESPTIQKDSTPEPKEEPKEETPKDDPKGTEEPKEEAKADTEESKVVIPELPKVLHPLDEQDDPSLEDIDPKFTKIRSNVERLREKLRKAREDGATGRALVEMAKAENLDPHQFAALVRRQMLALKGDPNAIAEMAAELHQRGVKFEQEKPDNKAGEIEAEATRIYQEVFAKGVEDRHIDEDYAKARAKALAEKAAQQKSVAAPKVVVPPQQPAQVDNRSLELASNQRLEALDSQFAQSYKKVGLDYAPIQAETIKRIQERVSRGEQIPYHMREYVYSETVRQVQTELLAKQRQSATPVVKPTNTLSPTTRNAPTNLNDMAAIKRRLVDEMMAGSF